MQLHIHTCSFYYSYANQQANSEWNPVITFKKVLASIIMYESVAN